VPTDESIEFEFPMGGRKMDYQIWQDASLDKDLVKCDFCSEFVPLVGGGRSTTHLKRHWDSKDCQVIQRQNNPPAKVPFVFINSFLEAGASQIHSNPLVSTNFIIELKIGYSYSALELNVSTQQLKHHH